MSSNEAPLPRTPTETFPKYRAPPDPYHNSSIPHSLSSPTEQDTAKHVYAPTYSTYGTGKDGRPTRRTICGIPTLLFFLVFTLVLIAIAGSVGGGVAGSMASKQCRNELDILKQSSSSSTPTRRGEYMTSATSMAASRTASTNAGSPSATVQDQQAERTIIVPETGCPGVNGTIYTVIYGKTTSTFMRICDTVKGGADMFQISTPSWDLCMDACAEYNDFVNKLQSKGSTPACGGVSYVPEWSAHPEYAASNYTTSGSCWFKSNMDGSKDDWVVNTEVVSSVRQP